MSVWMSSGREASSCRGRLGLIIGETVFLYWYGGIQCCISSSYGLLFVCHEFLEASVLTQRWISSRRCHVPQQSSGLSTEDPLVQLRSPERRISVICILVRGDGKWVTENRHGKDCEAIPTQPVWWTRLIRIHTKRKH
jgi:hypothetical protein